MDGAVIFEDHFQPCAVGFGSADDVLHFPLGSIQVAGAYKSRIGLVGHDIPFVQNGSKVLRVTPRAARDLPYIGQGFQNIQTVVQTFATAVINVAKLLKNAAHIRH